MESVDDPKYKQIIEENNSSWKQGESYATLNSDNDIAVRLDRELNSPSTTNLVIIEDRRNDNGDLPLACCLGLSLLACNIL